MWVVFFKISFYKQSVYDIKVGVNSNSANFNSSFYNFFLLSYLVMFICIYFNKYTSCSFFFNFFYIDNYINNLLIILYSVNVIFFVTVYYIFEKENFSYNLIFPIFNIAATAPIILITNNVLVFIFLLEIVSCFIFYKFICSKNIMLTKDGSNKVNYKSYLDMIFFQYWVNFFSSILLFYSLTLIYYYFGTSEWKVLNYLITVYITEDNNLVYYILFNVFVLGIFLKLGIAPMQLFKIEIYNGLPLYIIFYYTVFYFLIFMYFLFIIFFRNLYNVTAVLNTNIFILVIVGLLYSLVTLFNQRSIKSFLAYSTILNSLVYILLLTYSN